jgi:hypothetical protein
MRPRNATGSPTVAAFLAGLAAVLMAPRIFAWTAPPLLQSSPATPGSVSSPASGTGDGGRAPGGGSPPETGTGVAPAPPAPIQTPIPVPRPNRSPPPIAIPVSAPSPSLSTLPTSASPSAPDTVRGSSNGNTDVVQTGEEPDSSPTPAGSPLVITGYVDVGYANASGNGTSFRPGDTRVPVDYGVDSFATAVNSRGDVASTDSGGLFTNGFLPRSVGIGGTPSFLINTANFDFRYTAPDVPVLVFTRVQLLPRLESTGDVTRVVMEQAFGRLAPLKGAELTISAGKFDSVFGIEYLDNQANFRVGITPSLMARYTTGQSVGAKVFYRYQIPAVSSAISFNAAATNSGTFVEALQGPDRSLTGTPVLSARLSFDGNLEKVSIKLGASGVSGPRNDQPDSAAQQALWGLDWRVFVPTFTLSGEFVNVSEGEGIIAGKQTGAGTFPVASGFHARGFWVQAAEDLPLPLSPIRLTVYGRYDRRHAYFHAFIPVTVDRFTTGVNIGLGQSVQVKGEIVINRELEGAPQVDNNVYTSSVVWTW